jgi:hypothetical protein
MMTDAAEIGRRVSLLWQFLPSGNNAFERRSHARCACDHFVFAFLLQTATSYQGINTIRDEN